MGKIQQTLTKKQRLLEVFSLLPVVRNKVVFVSYFGKGYGDEGKAVTEALRAKNPKVKIVWAVKSQYKDTLPKGVHYVEYGSLMFYYHLFTSKVWLDNSRKPLFPKKRENQFYIQLWHGSYPLKRIEKDVEDHLSLAYLTNAKNDSAMADLMISGCRFFSNIIAQAFWYNGEILECGSPKLDRIFRTDEEQNDAVRKKLGIHKNTGVVLYAPTFRSDNRINVYNMDYLRVLEVLKEQFGKDYIFLIRFHPNVSSKATSIQYSDKVINVTEYQDLYELIPIADMVITDYSSVMFESALIGKTVLLYASDLQDYEKDRGFYFDVAELPFPLARDNEEIIRNIESFESMAYQEKVNTFMSKLGPFETGNASDIIAERILKIIHCD